MPRKNQPGCPCGCGQPSNCCLIKCSPCSLPQKDLLLTWSNAINGPGSTTLVYNSTLNLWVSACSNGLMYRLSCNAGQLELRVIYFTTGNCPTGTQQYCSNLRIAPLGLTLSKSVCSPLSVTFQSQTASCPAITSSGYTQFVVTDPSPAPNPPGLMCQSFGISFCAICLSGPWTVSVYQSMGGALVASGITVAAAVSLSWPGASGSYYITATADGFEPYAATLALTCGHATTISVIQTTPDDPPTVSDSQVFPDGLETTWISNLSSIVPTYLSNGFTAFVPPNPGWYALAEHAGSRFFYWMACSDGGFATASIQIPAFIGGDLWYFVPITLTNTAHSCTPLLDITNYLTTIPESVYASTTITWSA